MEPEEIGPLSPVGLAFSYGSQNFYVVEDQPRGQSVAAHSEVIAITVPANRRDLASIAATIDDPLNIVFDNENNRLLALQPTTGQLVEVRENPGSTLDRALVVSHNLGQLDIQQPRGLALDEESGSLFVLDASGPRIVRIQVGPGGNFAESSPSVIDLRPSGLVDPRGIALDPTTANLHVLDLVDQALYELTQSGNVVATRDLTPFGLTSPQAMVFAPSGDQTDDPAQMSLFLADSGSSTDAQGTGQIVEFSLLAAATLPAGTTLLPTTPVHTIDVSNAAWNPSAPDPTGIDYLPSTGRLLMSDSEVDEMSSYFTGNNVFDTNLSGTLISTCSTTNLSRNGFSDEPTGLAINRNNNRIYFTDDDANMLHEVSLGPDGIYCTADDVRTAVNVGTVYNIQDAEDVAYGNNRLFIAGGSDEEVYIIPLGPNGVLGGGDDGPLTHFDTAALGFSDLEGIGYHWDNNTLLILSAGSTDTYLGETTQTGTLLHAYDLNYVGLTHREDVTYAPASQNSAFKSVYITDRGVDNNDDPNENDGQIWEINISGSVIPTGTPSSTFTPTPTGSSPTPTNTPTLPPSGNAMSVSFASNGTVNGVAFADEDILRFDGQSWSLLFDGSDVGVGSADVSDLYMVDPDSILMAFTGNVTLPNGLAVSPQDIVRFDATSLGPTTAGAFSMYFDGSDVAFDASGERIDGLSVLPDGQVLLSTTGDSSVSGVAGKDEDLLAFTPATLGANTSGSWAMYFDGSDVGLSNTTGEDIDSLDVVSGNIYLSTTSTFSVNGLSGAGEDVFICAPISLGATTSCSFDPSLVFDGSTWGLAGNSLDGFDLESGNPNPSSTPTAAPSSVPTATNTPTAIQTPTGAVSPTPTSTLTNPPTPTNTPTSTPTSLFTATPTNTPAVTGTPTSTPAIPAADLIFADSFESGNFSAWTSSTTDAGDLSVSAAAALKGSQGMQALIDDINGLYLTSDHPNAEPRYRARFYLDPNSLTMVSGDLHNIFKGYAGTSTDVFRVELRFSTGAYQIRAGLINDAATWINTNWFTIADASHAIEVDWRGASSAGANDGGLTLWIDDAQQADLTGIDNDTLRVDRARLGPISSLDTGTSGTSYFDAFESRRETYIGP